MARLWLRRLGFLLGLLALGVLIGGQMGLLSGTRPGDIGVQQGRLKPAPTTPNCVNSQSTGGYAAIAPLRFSGDGAAALKQLAAVIEAMPGATLIERRANYLYAEYATKWLGFVDDVEFVLDAAAGVIHVRSASRLGRKDFGVNRARVETIRARFNPA
jgi:uncharacterized protein (DUF1499 family)